jgi:hypothetical protein
MANEHSAVADRLRQARQLGLRYSQTTADLLETLVRELPRRHALQVIALVEHLEVERTQRESRRSE